MGAVSLKEQVACVRREIRMREGVYARWVAQKKMTQVRADQELAAMRAVLVTLEGHKDLEARHAVAMDDMDKLL